MSYDHTVIRTPRNEITIETIIPLGFDRRELRVETRKSNYGVGILTRCFVVRAHADGKGYSQACGGLGGDFSRRLLANQARGTEKNMVALHMQSLEGIREAINDATAHYRMTGKVATAAEPAEA